MPTPILGLSLVGRQERVDDWTALKKHGIASVRWPIRWPLKPEHEQSLEAARDAGFFMLGVLQPEPQDSTWMNTLASVVERLKSFISHWEISTEPDDPHVGWPADGLVTYAACLLKAAALIKRADPQAQIHNGGLGRSLPKGIAQLCDLGAGAAVDVWNVHPYMNPLMPDAKGAFHYFQDIIQHTLIKQGQATKPLWWSSIACPGMRDPNAAKAWWLGKNPTEIMQAQWIKIIYATATQARVERIFWEGWRDDPSSTGTGIDYFGLQRADGSAKPALAEVGHCSGIGL